MEGNMLLTTKEVADLMGVHVNTVRAMTEDGRLKGIKTKGEKGHWRFRKNDIEAFMNLNKVETIDSILNGVHYLLDDIPESLLGGEPWSNESTWQFVNRYYGIRSVFGSLAIHADMETYRNIIDRKGFIWLGEGSTNFMDAYAKNKNKSAFAVDKFLSLESKFAFGVIKAPSLFDEYAYSLVPLLVIKDRDGKRWVIDGTLQQFYPNLDKGLVVLPLEKAKELYIGLTVYDKADFAELYNDLNVSERFIERAKQLEKESTESV